MMSQRHRGEGLTLAAGLCMLTVLGSLMASEAEVFRLAESYAVAGEELRVADLFPDRELPAGIGSVVVLHLHDDRARSIDGERIQRSIERHHPGTRLAIAGTSTVQRQRRMFGVETLDAAAEAAIIKHIAEEADAELTIERSATALSVLADADDPAQLRCDILTHRQWGQIPVRVIAERDNIELARTMVIIDVQAYRRLPVARRDLRRGEVLSLSDVVLERRLLTGHERNEPPAIEELQNCVVRVPLARGEIVDWRSVRPIPAVRSGARVVMEYRGDGFVLSVAATAMNDGMVGDTIRVRPADGGTPVLARVEGKGRVVAESP